MSKLSEFFQKHIGIIRKGRLKCIECQSNLQGTYSEVCHIISKGDKYNPEVACEDDNIIYLCPNCHNQFDRTLRHRSEMSCFKHSVAQFKKIQHLILKTNKKEVRFYEEQE